MSAALAVGGLALTALAPVRTADLARAIVIEPLTSPAAADTSEPQLTVAGHRVILSWLEVDGPHAALKFAERTPAGWSEPRTVASGTDLWVNPSDVPSVRALADGTLAAAWLRQNRDSEEAYDVMLSWSHDDGRTWSRAVRPHRDGTQTQHGFVTLFQAPGAGLGVVWLDGRATHPDRPMGQQGDMSLRAATYGTDGKERQNVAVDMRVCDCCSTSAAETAEGVVVAYRDRSATEIRDISLTRLTGGQWSKPVPVHSDGWKINACPINGPAMAARGRDLAVGWFTGKDDKGQAWIAFSHDAGRTFAPPIRVDEQGSLGHVGVALMPDGSAAVSWVEFLREGAQVRVRQITSSGERSPFTRVAAAGGTRVPRIAGTDSELLFAWTDEEQGTSHVRTARAVLAK